MDFTQFDYLSKEMRTDIALCALVENLTGQMTKHLDVMKKMGKDTDVFIFAYGAMIHEISSSPTDTLKALRLLITDE